MGQQDTAAFSLERTPSVEALRLPPAACDAQAPGQDRQPQAGFPALHRSGAKHTQAAKET